MTSTVDTSKGHPKVLAKALDVIQVEKSIDIIYKGVVDVSCVYFELLERKSKHHTNASFGDCLCGFRLASPRMMM